MALSFTVFRSNSTYRYINNHFIERTLGPTGTVKLSNSDYSLITGSENGQDVKIFYWNGSSYN